MARTTTTNQLSLVLGTTSARVAGAAAAWNAVDIKVQKWNKTQNPDIEVWEDHVTLSQADLTTTIQNTYVLSNLDEAVHWGLRVATATANGDISPYRVLPDVDPKFLDLRNPGTGGAGIYPALKNPTVNNVQWWRDHSINKNHATSSGSAYSQWADFNQAPNACGGVIFTNSAASPGILIANGTDKGAGDLFGKSLTILARIRLSSYPPPSAACILSTSPKAASNRNVFGVTAGGVLAFGNDLSGLDSVGAAIAAPSGLDDARRFVTVAVVVEEGGGAPDRCTVYYGDYETDFGVLAESLAFSAYAPLTSHEMRIGTLYNGGTSWPRPFDGFISEIQCWRAALTVEQMQEFAEQHWSGAMGLLLPQNWTYA